MENTDSDYPEVTLERLKEHYKHCIRLSASNKINAKNAFVLQLIDYMHDLVNQDDGQMNFKIASSALDVGAKIYSHRVDCVHSEAQKVASGLLMALDGKTPKGNDQQNDDEANDTMQDGSNPDINDSYNDNNNEENRVSKKKSKKRNTKTVVDDPQTLNGKLEKIVIGDLYLDGLSREYDMSCPAALICYNPKTQPNGVITIDSNFLNLDYCNVNSSLALKYLQAPQAELEKQTSSVEAEAVCLVNKSANCAQIIRESKNYRICPKLENFLFRDRTTTVEGLNSITDPAATVDVGGDESRIFDICDDPIDDPIEDDAEHRFQPDLFNNDDVANDSNDNNAYNDNNPIPNLDLIGAAAPNEYGYTDEPRVKDTWAGPHAWKTVTKSDGQDGIKLEPGLPKSARKRIKLEPKQIDFNRSLDEICLKLGDKELRYASDSIKRWKKPFVPQDHNLDSESVHQTLIQQFLRPEEKYASVLEDRREDQNNPINGMNCTNDCPQSPPMAFDDFHDDIDDVDDDDEFRADPMVDGMNQTLTQSAADGEFAGENLIDQPFSVTHVQISYAKVAKKMDIRRLKRAMWDLLLPPAIEENRIQQKVTFRQDVPLADSDDDANDDESTIKEGDQSKVLLNFSDLYGELPMKINPKMAHDLSQPIAFVTLLHLANEKNLRLIPKPDSSDFIIEME